METLTPEFIASRYSLKEIEEKIKAIQGDRIRWLDPALTSLESFPWFPPSSDKQLRFIGSNARILEFLGGNRSSKTVSGGIRLVCRMLGNRLKLYNPALYDLMVSEGYDPRPSIRCWAIAASTEASIKIQQRIVFDWLPKSEIEYGEYTEELGWKQGFVRLKNGSTCLFKTWEQPITTFQGEQLDEAWIDDEGCPHSYMTEITMRLTDRKGYLTLTVTPTEGINYVYDMIETKADGKKIQVIESTIHENRYISKEEIEERGRILSEDEKLIRFEGKRIRKEGLVYKYNISLHKIIPVFEENPLERGKMFVNPDGKLCIKIPFPDWYNTYVGIDPGTRLNFAAIFGKTDNAGNLFLYDEYLAPGETIRVHIDAILERLGCITKETFLQKVNKNHNYFMFSDQTASQEIMDMNYWLSGYGVAVQPAENAVEPGINRVRMWFEQKKIFFFDTLENFFNEYSRYSWRPPKRAVDEDPRPKVKKKGDHICDSIRYLIEGNPQPSFRPSSDTLDMLKGTASYEFWKDRLPDQNKRGFRGIEFDSQGAQEFNPDLC